jgi:hypothetical protein
MSDPDRVGRAGRSGDGGASRIGRAAEGLSGIQAGDRVLSGHDEDSMKVVTIHDDGTTEEYEIEDELFTLTPRASAPPSRRASVTLRPWPRSSRMVHGHSA